MKLRAQHVIVLLGLGIAVFLAYAVLLSLRGDAPPSPGAAIADPEMAFLNSIRQEAVAAPRGEEVGSEPPGGSEGVPKLEMATEDYDIGVIPNDKPSDGEVMIYNRGDYDLVITNVTTSCGCTLGSIDKKVIEPGGQAPMKVTVFPDKIPDFEATRVLTIYSNDKKKPQTEVRVTAHVQPEFLIEPRDMDFGDVPKGEVVTRQVKIQQAQPTMVKDKQEPLKVEKIETLGAKEAVAVELKPVPEDQWAKPGHAEYVVDVTLDTNKLPPGPLKSGYSMHLNVPRLHRFGSEILANVTAPYTVKPRAVALGRVTAGKESAGEIEVHASAPFELTDVAVSGGEILAAVQPADAATVPEAPVQPAANAATGETGAQASEGGAYGAKIVLSVAPDAAPNLKREELKFNVKMGEKVYGENVRVTAIVSDASDAPDETAAAPSPAAQPAVSAPAEPAQQ